MKNKKVPMRRCVGCMTSKPKQELIRLVLQDETTLLIDETGKANGRGVYLCKEKDCFEKAKKRKAINRSLKCNVNEEQLNHILKELLPDEGKDL